MTTALTVDLNANWRLYATHVPTDSASLGTVRRPDGQTGALVRLPSGVYAQLNAGAVRSLDQAAVGAAMSAARGSLPTAPHG